MDEQRDVVASTLADGEEYGYNRGVRDERSRIRQEILAATVKICEASRSLNSAELVRHYVQKDITSAIDRICPQEGINNDVNGKKGGNTKNKTELPVLVFGTRINPLTEDWCFVTPPNKISKLLTTTPDGLNYYEMPHHYYQILIGMADSIYTVIRMNYVQANPPAVLLKSGLSK